MKKNLSQTDAALYHFNMAVQRIESYFNTNRIKNYAAIISKWKSILSTSNTQKTKPEVIVTTEFMKFEVFDHPISFARDEYEVEISWDINLAGKKLRSQGSEQYILNTNNVVINEESINKDPFYIKIDNPIIVLVPCALSSTGYTIINGNHRIMEAQQNDISTLPAYFVKDNSHLDWMLSDLMRNVFLMQQDITNIRNILMLPRWRPINKTIKSLNVWSIH